MQPDRAFWAGKRVCVTGGTGFLGWQIMRQLLDLGAKVRVLALQPAKTHPIHTFADVDTIWGDVRDPDVVRRALKDQSVIFHTAGVVGAWGIQRQRMWSVHVDGTKNVLEVAPKDARIVHTSSLTAVGGSRNGHALTEDSPFRLEGTKIDYVLAKRAAEEVALEAHAAGRSVVITNPGYLVGPEDFERSIMGRFCVRFWKGRILMVPPGGLNLVDARDVATGHLLAAERGVSGRRYLLGGENHRYTTFLEILASVSGCRPRLMPRIPLFLLAAIAGVAEFRARLTGKEPYPSFGHLHNSRYDWFASSQRAINELGYTARPLIESLRDSYEWHRRTESIRPRGLNRWLLRPA